MYEDLFHLVLDYSPFVCSTYVFSSVRTVDARPVIKTACWYALEMKWTLLPFRHPKTCHNGKLCYHVNVRNESEANGRISYQQVHINHMRD